MAHTVLMVSSLFLLLLITHQSSGEDYDQAMRYIGCFLDKPGGVYRELQLSIDMCLSHCRARSFTYFFIKADNLCRCADVRPTKRDTGCNNTAQQDFNFDDPVVVSVYKINDFSTLHLEYVACQRDNETGNDFTQKSLFVDKTNLTLEKCMKHCVRLQHSYIALQNGEECRCGQTYSKHTDRGRCCTNCIGDELQYCGGNSSNSIYKISETKPIVYSKDCYMLSESNNPSGDSLETHAYNLNMLKCSVFCKEYQYMSIRSRDKECSCHSEQYTLPFGIKCEVCELSPLLCKERVMVTSYGITGLSYRGCFTEGNPSTSWGVHQPRSHFPINTKTMTLNECGKFCAAGKYQFMGLTEGHGCKCMDAVTGLGRKSLCQLPCKGDKNQICGDVQKYSVYSLNNITPVSY